MSSRTEIRHMLFVSSIALLIPALADGAEPQARGPQNGDVALVNSRSTALPTSPAQNLTPPPADRSERELIASLEQSATVVDLYDQRRAGPNAHGQMAQEVQRAVIDFRQKSKRNLRLQRVESETATFHPLQGWMRNRDDLQALPFLPREQWQIDPTSAQILSGHSNRIGQLSRFHTIHNSTMLLDVLANPNQQWLPQDIPSLVQIIPEKEARARRHLVSILGRIDHPRATLALAQRAVFDPEPEIRKAAVTTLADRDTKDFKNVLLAALRYPWAPVADHAAIAIVGLNMQTIVPELEELTKQPDPTQPFEAKPGQWQKREFVAIQHLRNCCLCHAPSVSQIEDPQGMVPDPAVQFPPPPKPNEVEATSTVTRSQSSGNAYGSPITSTEEIRAEWFVRADVTYLRQDFSTLHAIDNPGPWPKEQRFDYLVAHRPLTRAEIRALSKKPKKTEEEAETPSYPQREAIRWALEQLALKRGS